MSDERLNLPSASRFEILALCPGSEALRRSLPPEALESEDSEWAATGTRIHKAAETDNPLELSPEETEIFTNGRITEQLIVSAWAEDFQIESFKEGPREQRLWLHDDRLRPLTSAKLDKHYVSIEPAGYALSVDWKSLWNPNLTPAIKNWQGRVQAVVLQKEHGVSHVRMAFNKAKFGTADIADYNAEALWRTEFSIKQALWESEQPGAQLRPGDHCRWCPCKAFCRAAVTQSVVPIAYTPPDPNGKSITKKNAAALVENIPIEAVREAWGKRTQIGYIVAAMGARLKALPPEEHYRLGLKLNQGRKSDHVRDVKAAFDAMMTSGLFTEEQVWECMDMSKTRVIELFQQVRNCRDSEAEMWFEIAFDDFMERGRGADILADA